MTAYNNMLGTLFPRADGFTPQYQPLPDQIPNNAGGFNYEVNDWTKLDRFLILGTESGTYYVKSVELTKQNAKTVAKLLDSPDGIKVVDKIKDIVKNNRAPKIDSCIFTLAMAASCKNAEVRKAALGAVSEVCVIGTHILMFASFVNEMRGWGRGLRKAIGDWFRPQNELDYLNRQIFLVYQSLKYNQRNGWSLRDILRLSHPQYLKNNEIIDWIVHPDKSETILNARKAFPKIEGKYQAIEAKTSKKVAAIITKFDLPREAVPTDHLNSKEVWLALLEKMPIMAMVRNLGKMSSVGLFEPFCPSIEYVLSSFADEKKMKKIHPIKLYLALRTYQNGKGELGKLTWNVNARIVEALNQAFSNTFSNIEPTGKKILIGIDGSGSMNSDCLGSSIITCLEAAVATAMSYMRSEKQTHTIAFDTKVYEMNMTWRENITQIVTGIKEKAGGGTDLSMPIRYALEKKLNVDAFVVLTDNETWAGHQHPVQTLNQYRKQINPNAKLVVLCAAATDGMIVEESDPLSLGIFGFDAAIPEVISNFIRG